jgi:Protein of unknown function (DUF2911)
MRKPTTLVILGLAIGMSAQAQTTTSLACEPQGSEGSLMGRQSPYDSVTVHVGDRVAKLCYSRPLARGRVIFGELVPFDMLWRTGANEPTTIHLPFAAEIAGIPVEAGKYSIYTVPSTREWVVVVNASTSQGGLTRDEGQFKNEYVAEIRAQEVGRALVSSAAMTDYVEQFTVRSERTGPDGGEIILEWERTRVRIPIRARRQS